MLWLLTALFFVSAKPAEPPRAECKPKELARLDCRLTVSTYNLRLLKDTLAWNDGTWHTVDDLPLKGDGVAWEKASFEFINGWPILQLWIWDAGVGENKVQSLHWYVADAERRRLTIIAEGVVRKRRTRAEEGPPAEQRRSPRYIYDVMEPHALKPLKNGSLEWSLKNDKKLIERVKHGV